MLIAFIVLTVLALMVGQFLPGFSRLALPPAFYAHIALAVGGMTLITAAMQHFVPVLCRTRGAGRWMARLPFLMLLAGVLATAVFAGWLEFAWISVAAGLALAGMALMMAWMLSRAQAALGRPHAGLYWYLAAMVCLGVALVTVWMIPFFPEWHAPLRAFHWHLNLYGFMALTAVGTLQVLMPTAAGRPDPHAAVRLRQDLPWAVLGALCLALGAAAWPVLAWLGAVLWTGVVVRMVWAWLRQYPRELFALHRAEPLLLAASLGLILSVWLAAQGKLAPLTVFLPAFLMPLVTGAAAVLAPVWLKLAEPAVHARGRAELARWGGLRATFFASAGVLPVLGYSCAGMPALLALLWFVALFLWWLWREV